MPIRIMCSACGAQAEVADTLAGKSVQCQRCHAQIPVVAPKRPQPIRPQPMQSAQTAQPVQAAQPAGGHTLRPMNTPADDFGLGGPGSSSGGDFGLGGGSSSHGLPAGGPGLGLGGGIPSGPQGPQLFTKQVEPDTPLWQNIWVLVGGGAGLLFILLTAIIFLNGSGSRDEEPEPIAPVENRPAVSSGTLSDPSAERPLSPFEMQPPLDGGSETPDPNEGRPRFEPNRPTGDPQYDGIESVLGASAEPFESSPPSAPTSPPSSSVPKSPSSPQSSLPTRPRPTVPAAPAQDEQYVAFWEVEPPQIEPPNWTANYTTWQLETPGDLLWASQQGPFLAVVDKESLSVWNVAQRKRVSQYAIDFRTWIQLRSAELNSTGTRLLLHMSQRAYEALQAPGVSAGERVSHVFVVLDAANGRVVREISLPQDFSIDEISWAHDNLVLAQAREHMALVDIAGQAEPWILASDSWQDCATVSPDGSLLAKTNGPLLELYDVATRKHVGRRSLKRSGAIESLSFSPDGSKLAGRGRSEILTCWGMADGKQLCQVKSLGGIAIRSGEDALKWSADSQCLLVHSQHIVAANSGVKLGEVSTNRSAGGMIQTILPDNKVVVSDKGRARTGVFIQTSPLFTPELSDIAQAVASGQSIEDARLPALTEANWSATAATDLAAETAVLDTPVDAADAEPSAIEVPLAVPPGSIQAALVPSPAAQLAVVVSNANQRLPIGEASPQELARLSEAEFAQRIDAKLESDRRRTQHAGEVPASDVVVLDLAGKRESGRWNLPTSVGLVDISPDGSRVLSLSLDQADRVDVWTTEDGSHIQGWRPVTSKALPDGFSSIDEASIESASFATNDIVVLHHKSAGQLSAWNVAEAKSLWRVTLDPGDPWTLSPKGSYVHVFVSSPTPAMLTLETATGKLVGRQPLEVREKFSAPAQLAVHPDGRRFALNFSRRLWTWTAGDSQVQSVTLKSTTPVPPYWLAGKDNFVVLNEVVIQPEAKVVVWQFIEHHPLIRRRSQIERRVIMSRRADPRYWSLIDQSGQSVLTAQVQPDAAMLAAIPTLDPKNRPKILWGPGVEVKLAISAGEDNERVARAWKTRLESQGMTVSDSAQTTVNLSIQSAGSRSEEYVESRFPGAIGLPPSIAGRSGGTVRTVSWTAWTYSINITGPDGASLVSETVESYYSPPTSIRVQEGQSMPDFNRQARGSAVSGLMNADPVKGELVDQPTGQFPGGEPVPGFGQTRFGSSGRHMQAVFSQNGAFWPLPKSDFVQTVKPKPGILVNLPFEPPWYQSRPTVASARPSQPGIPARPGVPAPEQPQGPQWTVPDLPWPLGATETARDTSRITKLAELLRNGDDVALQQTLKWSSKMTKPAVSQRWGIGVVMDGLPEDQLVTADLQSTVGDVGRGCIAALQNAITQGKHGPASGDGAAIAVLLEPHTRGGLIVEAQKLNLDMLGYFELRRVGNEVRMQFRVVDVSSGQTHWSSSSLNSREVTQAQRRQQGDPAREWAISVADAVTETFALADLPEELDKEAVTDRVELLGTTRDKAPLAMKVAEIWLYHVREVLSADETVAALTPLLESEDARKFVTGTAEERASVVDARFE